MRTRVISRWAFVFAVSLVFGVSAAAARDLNTCNTVIPVPRADNWWQQRHKAMNDRVKQGNVDLLFIGDSITQGWEGEGKDVWNQFYGKRNAVNLGIGGDQTQHVLWRLDNGNIDGISPKLAVIMIGTNNAGSNSPEEIAAGNKAIVERLRTKLPEMKILLLGIFPRGADNNDGLRQTNMKANEIISTLADGINVFYMDIGPKFLGPDGTLSKDVMPDLLHLNAQSYKTWAEAIEPKVKELMGETQDVGQCRATTPTPRPDAGWQNRHQAMNERVKQGNVDLLFIGDSITQGWGGNGKEVWDKFYAKRNAVNLGISGDQTGNVLWRLDNGNIDGISPKLAVIMIGTNNAGHEPHQPAEEIAAGIKAIVQRLRTKLPTTKILLLAIFPRGADNNDPIRQINMKTNEIISKLDDGKNVFYLDIGPKFLAPDGTLSTDVMPDRLHLNPQSYLTWAEAIEPKVKELMGE